MAILKLLSAALPLFAMASLTLGLAPFFPEPHVWEKIRWIASGTIPSDSIYWLDFLMHGSPWVLLLAGLAARIWLIRSKKTA